MKTFRNISVWVLVTALIACRFQAWSQDKGTGTLLILITGVNKLQGQLLVALYKSADDFPGDNPAIGWGVVPKSREELIKLEKVPFGKYAIAVIYDLNNDGILAKNFLGIPTEAYGFSNNVMGSCGPPSFQQASFIFASNYETKIIDLQYGTGK